MERHHKIMALAACTAIVCGIACRQIASDATQSAGPTVPAAVAKVELAVEGMTCAACNVTVAAAAKSVAGVTEATASSKKKRAWVSYEPEKTSVEAIAAAVTKAGYPATPIAPGES